MILYDICLWLHSVWQYLCSFMSLKMALFYSSLWLRSHCIIAPHLFPIHSSILTYYTCVCASLNITEFFILLFSLYKFFIPVYNDNWLETIQIYYLIISLAPGVQFPVRLMVVWLRPLILAWLSAPRGIGPWWHAYSPLTSWRASPLTVTFGKGSPDTHEHLFWLPLSYNHRSVIPSYS